MAALIQAYDWAGTSLGPLPRWPQSLRTAVDIVLSSPVPMVMLWGADGIMIYNDAYSGFAGGRHPRLLGSKVLEGWPEVADFNARIMQVGLGGGTLSFRDQQLVLYRHGAAEDVWMDLDYSPVRDESGAPAGVLAIVVETTERVQAERRLAFQYELSERLRTMTDPKAVMAAAAETLGQHLQVGRCGYGEVDGSGEFFTVERDWTDGVMASMAGKSRLNDFGIAIIDELKAGRTVRIDDPLGDSRTAGAEAGYAASGGIRAGIAIPLVKRGQLVAIFYVHQTQPRRWSEADDALLRDTAARTWAAVERARAETAQRESEEQLRLLADALPTMVSYIDAGERYCFVNRAYEDWFEQPRGALIGKTIRELLGEETYALRQPHVEAALRGEPRHIEAVIPRADGLRRHTEAEYLPRVGPDGTVAGFYVLVADVTEQKGSEAALQAERDRAAALAAEQSAILGQLAEGVIVTDPEGRITFVNEAAARIHGVTRLDVPPDEYAETYHLLTDDGLPYPSEQLPLARAVLNGETTTDARWRIVRPDGSQVIAVGSARPVLAPDGMRLGAVLTLRDDTGRADAEEALRLRGEEFYALAENIPTLCWAAYADGHIFWYNRRWFEYTGTSRDDQEGWGWESVHDPEMLPKVLEQWRYSLATGLPFEMIFPLKGHDGVFRPFLTRIVPIHDAEGRLVRWFGTNADITEEQRQAKELEARISERTAERDRIWNLSRDLLAVANFQGYITSANPAWETMLGRPVEAVLARPFAELIHPDDHAGAAAIVGGMQTGKTVTRFEDRLLHADGSIRWISWTAVPEGDAFYAIGRDITEEKRSSEALLKAEEQLRQSQKMEAVGQLTGGIAHDFNNLLQGIVGSLDLVQKRISQGRTAELDRFVSGAMTSANRAAALTHRLLAFSRRQPLDPKPVKANPLIASMEDLLRRTMGERIEIELVLAGGLWLTLCDQNQLESAILNLAINARDAMPEGGKLTIETCNAHLDNVYAAKTRDVNPGQYVCICVTDTGTGMPQDVIERAFDPFFTTKPIGQGTGLGLSMIYGFARQSEGYAKIYSEIGQGTTVKLYLPRYRGDDAPEEERPGLTQAHRAEEGEVVLVVEDDLVVRGLILEVLHDLGYRALEAGDGPSGLQILQSDRRIDLLVTDIGLPGLNGRQIADAARITRPELKVLFMTGYAENAALANGFLMPGMEMVTKPFAMETMATRIRSMIERK